MAKMVYDEYYGELTYSLRAAIRKHNISPADYTFLERDLGVGNYAEIEKAIKAGRMTPDRAVAELGW